MRIDDNQKAKRPKLLCLICEKMSSISDKIQYIISSYLISIYSVFNYETFNFIIYLADCSLKPFCVGSPQFP